MLFLYWWSATKFPQIASEEREKTFCNRLHNSSTEQQRATTATPQHNYTTMEYRTFIIPLTGEIFQEVIRKEVKTFIIPRTGEIVQEVIPTTYIYKVIPKEEVKPTPTPRPPPPPPPPKVTVKPTEAVQIPVPEVKPMPKPTPPELVQIPVKPKVVPKPTPITSLKTENKQENRQNHFFYPNWQKLYQSCNSFNLLFQSTLTNCNFSHNFKSRYKLISYGKPQLSLNPYKKGSYIRVDFRTFQCRAIHPAPRGKTHHGSWTSQLPHPHLHTGDHKQQAKPTNRQTHRYTET